ncbi:MAG: nicotinic acid mononucleotide adenyltransferase [Flavobacteriaceae bacterium]
MKHFVYITLFTLSSLVAQENEAKRTFTQVGELIQFTEYHDNGELSQTGYFLDGKNHGVWVSYDRNGVKRSKGVFSQGKKVDRWFFWNEGALLEVDYKDNILQSAIKWGNAELIASKDE